MKKRALILILSILTLTLLITACTDNTTDAAVKSIEIVSGSIATECQVGDTLDFSGIKVKVTYDDDTTKEVGYSDVQISSVDTSTAGEKTVTVTYGEATAEFKVTVKEVKVEATLSSIKIVAGTVPTALYVGQSFDASGLQVEAIYSDGSKKVLTSEQVEKSAVDTTTAGDKTFTVTYEGKTDSITVKIHAITSVQVVANSIATKIMVGETLNTSALEVLVTYGDGSQKVVSASELTIGDLDTTTYGKKTVSITYNGVTIEHEIEVVGEVSITVLAGSVPTSVKVGAAYDASAIKATLLYSDNTREELDASKLTVSAIDTATAGDKTLTVTYNGLETTVAVKVVGVESITVTGVASEILKGAEFDLSAIQATIVFTDGSRAVVGKDDLTLGSIDNNIAGEQKLSVTYLDKSVECTVKVCTVSSIRVEGINKVVQAGDEIDLSQMKVYGVYNDSEETEILLTEGITTNIDEIDINSEEDKNLVVSYKGMYGMFSATVKITATAPELVDIKITSWTKFIEIGGTYNKNTVNVYAIYGNETEEKITNATISDIDTSKAGEATITVSYTEGGVTKEAEVTVQVLPVSKIEVSGIADLVNKGETLDTSALKATVTFGEGENAITKVYGIADGVTVSEPDTTSGGDKTLTITFYGKAVEFTYHVKAVSAIEIYSGLAHIIRTGHAIDYSALKIKITYTNGDEEIAATATLAGVEYAGTGVGDSTFTVTYEGKSATRTLVAATLYQIHALNGTVPSAIFEGNSLPYDSFRVTFVYEYTVDGVKKEEVFLVKVGEEPGLYYLYATSGVVNRTPLGIPYGTGLEINTNLIDENDSGDRAVQFIYLPTGAEYNASGIPLYSAQANIVIKGVKEIDIVPGSVSSNVKLGQDLDVSEIYVMVTYTDNTHGYITLSDLESISTVDTSSAGEKTLTVTYKGKTAEHKVTVVDTSAGEGALDGIIFGALLPDSLIARDTYKNNFKDTDNLYVVGDDNPYYLYLNVAVLDDNNKLVEVDGKKVPTAVKVYEIKLTESGEFEKDANGNAKKTLLEGDALAAVVTFDSKNNAYQFKSAAIGRVFELVIRPDEKYATYLDEAAVTASHIVTIVDGYNVYDEKELNLITVEHDRMLYEGPKSSTFSNNVLQQTVVDKFLADNGITTRGQDINAIILHGNMNIEVEDIPSEYFWTYTKDGVTKTELLDHLDIFVREIYSDDPFSIYGNYYSIYSYNLPCVVPKGVATNADDFSNSTLINFKEYWEEYYEAHHNRYGCYVDSTGNFIVGKYDPSMPAPDFPYDRQIVNVMDIAFRDNDPNSNDQSASERHMRGLACMSNSGVTSNITNVNIDAFYVSMRAESIFVTMNLDKVKFYNAWQGHIFVWSDNGAQLGFAWYDTLLGTEAAEVPTLTGFFGTKINITDSLLGKCGGPVILAQAEQTSKPCSRDISVDVVVDDKSELYSYVTGQEAWFVAVNQTPLAGQIVALSQLVQKSSGGTASYTSTEKINGVNTVNMVMVVMGAGLDVNSPDDYNASLTRGGQEVLKMVKDKNSTQPAVYSQAWWYDTYLKNTAGKAPILQTSAGGTCFSDGATGCFGLETGAPGTATPNCFQGDYITLYMSGMGILMEYYTP